MASDKMDCLVQKRVIWTSLHKKQEIYQAGLLWYGGESFFISGNIQHNIQSCATSDIMGTV